VVSAYERVHAGLVAGTTVFASISMVLLVLLYHWQQVDGTMLRDPILKSVAGIEVSKVSWEAAADVQEFSDDLMAQWQRSQLPDVVIPKDLFEYGVNQSGGESGWSVGEGNFGLDRRRVSPLKIDELQVNRWDLNFQVVSFQEYVDLLQSREVEIAAVGKSGQRVDYVKWVQGDVKTWSGLRKSERRFYFSHTKSQWNRWDGNLLREAGIDDSSDKVLLQFYPHKFLSKLEGLQNAKLAADGRVKTDIQKVRFWLKRRTGVVEVEKYEVEYR